MPLLRGDRIPCDVGPEVEREDGILTCLGTTPLRFGKPLHALKANGRLDIQGGHCPISVIYDRGRVFALDNRCPHNGLPARARYRRFSPRTVRALHAYGIVTLADFTVRVPRRRLWWTAIPDLRAASAKAIEAFFASYPALTERARALILSEPRGIVVPWESLKLPHEVDGSAGTFRAPAATCMLDANNDYDAIHAWLSLHESAATQRTYRKEADRLILWAIR